MKHVAQSSRRPDVFAQLALRLREMVREEHVNSLSGVERGTVRSTAPLIVEMFGSDLVLEDGDPDFSVGAWFRQYVLDYRLDAGDVVVVLREGHQWHLVDIDDPGSQQPWSFKDHTHTDPQGGVSGPGTRHSPTLPD